ncbi:MAG: FkbM family methyltransferase [Candidatus Omnitrophota bacterium]
MQRSKQILRYAGLALHPADIFNLAIMGYAHGHPFHSQDLPSRIGRRFFPTLIVRPAYLGGARIELDPSNLSHMVIFDWIVLEKEYNLQAVPFTPRVIIDCGAHIGFFSVLAARTYPRTRIVAFEPNPENAKFLKRQIALNKVNGEAVEAAVSTREGKGWFYSGCSFEGRLETGSKCSKEGYPVKTVNLPRLIKEINSDFLLLKIDIEGEEISLIPALIPHLPARCAIFFESHTGDEGWHRIVASLEAGGFKTEERRRSGRFINGFALKKP